MPKAGTPNRNQKEKYEVGERTERDELRTKQKEER